MHRHRFSQRHIKLWPRLTGTAPVSTNVTGVAGELAVNNTCQLMAPGDTRHYPALHTIQGKNQTGAGFHRRQFVLNCLLQRLIIWTTAHLEERLFCSKRPIIRRD
jgi:hypothetical protein